MPVLVICTVLLLAFAGGVVCSEISANRRIREKTLKGFGRIPEGDYELGDIVSYAKLCRKERQDLFTVDDFTWEDLNMDAVFRRVNNCQSTVGEQFLYERLHRLSPRGGNDELSALCSHFSQNPEEQEKIMVLLARLGKKASGGLPHFLEESRIYSMPLAPLYSLLAFLPFAALPVCFFFPGAGFCIMFLSICLNFYLYYRVKREIQGDLDRLRTLSSLLWFSEKLVSVLTYSPLRERVLSCLPAYRFLRGRLSGRMQKGYSDLELLQEYLHILTLRDLRIYRRAMQTISAHRAELRVLFESTGLLDAALSTLSFRKSLPYWASPSFQEKNTVIFSKLYHPLLRTPAPNSGSFSSDVLLTGSNASGKSTFLKALGVNAILAQSLFTCTAEHFSFRPGPVLSSMAVQDNLTAGESYFMAEIKSLKRVADAARAESCFLLIDEILKGTNTVERLAASQAVLEELHRRDCFCIAATHDEELPQRLSPQYENYHFQETLSPEGITFDYKLYPGPSNSRNAIALLSLTGFSRSVVARAEALAGKTLTEKGLPQR